MTRTGGDYIEGLRDGRAVFIDGERVGDVTTHPAFRGAVRSIAGLYDLAREPGAREHLTFEPLPGREANVAYLIPRTRKDLAHRRRGLRLWAERTFGLMGRSPDHVAGFLAGFAGNAGVFGAGFADNVRRFYERARDEDLYLSYVIVPPQIDRSRPAHQQEDPHLYAGVKEERDGGIVVRGAQMLGTGTAICDWIHLSNIVPLRSGDEDYAISLVVPAGAPGVRVLARRSYAQAATSDTTTRCRRGSTRSTRWSSSTTCSFPGSMSSSTATCARSRLSGGRRRRTCSATTRRRSASGRSWTSSSGWPGGSRR